MKIISLSIVIASVLIGVALLYSSGQTPQNVSQEKVENKSNVSIVDGKQIVDIRARGGYQPGKSIAKAGIPTVIRFTTKGTFDCSSFVRVPSLNISKILPQTGSEDVDIGIPKSGVLKGSCGMGMYPFEIEFRD